MKKIRDETDLTAWSNLCSSWGLGRDFCAAHQWIFTAWDLITLIGNPIACCFRISCLFSMRWWINQTRRRRRRIGNRVRNSKIDDSIGAENYKVIGNERALAAWWVRTKMLENLNFFSRPESCLTFLLQRQRFSNWLQPKKYPKNERRKAGERKSHWKGFIIHLLSAPVRKYRTQPGWEINIFTERSLWC